MSEALRARRATTHPRVNLMWLLVATIILAAQIWLLYSPATSSSMNELANQLNLVLEPLPGPTAPSEPGFDKVAHTSSFAFVTAALALAGIPWRWVLTSQLLHAPACEIIQQLFIPGRTGQISDFLMDLAGIVVATLIVWTWQRLTLTGVNQP